MLGRAITFDFHNTLVRCDEWFELEVRALPSALLRWLNPTLHDAHRTALDHAYRRLRSAVTRHGHELTAEQSLRLVFAGAGIAVDDATIRRGIEELMGNALLHAHPVDGAIETVNALAEAGVPLGVVSSAVYDPFLHWSLEKFGIRDRFRAVVTSASSGYYKSRPEIYWETLALLSASAKESVHVGDSMRYDVEGAARAGMRAVLLDHGRTEQGDPRPDATVETLAGAAPALLLLLERADK